MLIHSDKSILNGEEEQKFDDKDLCLICYDKMETNQNISILNCGHKYHYQCIYLTYKKLKNKKECPYCRSDGGYLDLPVGRIPEKYIHKEYLEYKKGNKDVLRLIEGKCKYILKRGKNAGCQCSFNIKTENGYCNRHYKLTLSQEVQTII